MSRILGIDPGTSRFGWGVIEFSGRTVSEAGFGLINASGVDRFQDKIRVITNGVRELLSEFDPEAVAVEEPFYAKNPKVLLRIGQTAGAVMAAAADSGKEVAAYSVLEIKQAVAGYGRADKRQVQEMVRVLLGMKKAPAPADASDALAAAICHYNNIR